MSGWAPPTSGDGHISSDGFLVEHGLWRTQISDADGDETASSFCSR
jgi:hypothetical protein